MHILFVTPYYFPELKFGGPPKRLHAMARALVERGNRVTVVTIHSEARRRMDSIRMDGVVVQYLPWVRTRGHAIPRHRHELAAHVAKADVVHLFGLYNLICPMAAWQAVKGRKPFVMEPMGMFTPRVRSLGVKRLYNATLTNWMARRASAIIATSDVEAAELRPLGFKTDIVVRRNGVDLASFQTLPDREVFRQQWGIASDSQLVLFLGRISAKKNLRELVQAFGSIDAPGAKLVIAGPVSEPDYMHRLQQDIRASGRSEDILIRGPLYDDDLKGALAAADLFVLPSMNENFGNSAAEAIAANLPVLLTDTCGIASAIHNRAGLAVPLGVENLAAGLQTMTDPEKRGALVAKREEVKRELSWDEPIAQTERLYEEVISGRTTVRTETTPDTSGEIR